MFCFFKQKTAYEMRISDWSSDVCSSDLDLLSDPKELAEHLMLLDLGRNDVGRVAAVGSVKVTEKNAIELYSHVMHLVSNVEGRLAAGKDAMDALIAGFPDGTVPGAPQEIGRASCRERGYQYV